VGQKKILPAVSLHSWQDFVHEYFCLGGEVLNANAESPIGFEVVNSSDSFRGSALMELLVDIAIQQLKTPE